MGSSACSLARCCSRWAISCSAIGWVLGKRRRRVERTPPYKRQSDALVFLALEYADQASDQHGQEQLTADDLEGRKAARDIGARQIIAITQRREGHEAVVD